ncbi:hypothetical protein [Streptomyces sp. URMC 124]|uniref:hypothetical protein n=1 Tax=Streptomyces sp. URMC 124 TaxID=3423405 RepID=UPI003F1A07A9
MLQLIAGRFLLAIGGAMVMAGIAALTWFVRRRLQSADPLLDVRLFASRPFLAAALATVIAMMAIGAAHETARASVGGADHAREPRPWYRSASSQQRSSWRPYSSRRTSERTRRTRNSALAPAE